MGGFSIGRSCRPLRFPASGGVPVAAHAMSDERVVFYSVDLFVIVA